jgi:hypothetical protein
MADPPPYPASNGDTGDDTGGGPDRGSTSSTPRWVKVFGIIGGILVLLVVIMMLIGGEHGPGRHTPSGDAPASSATEDASGGHAPPEGGHG